MQNITILTILLTWGTLTTIVGPGNIFTAKVADFLILFSLAYLLWLFFKTE